MNPLVVESTIFGQRSLRAPRAPSTLLRPNQVVRPIDIDATVEQVWEVLIDFERYPEWNPLNRSVEPLGAVARGVRVKLGVSWGPYEQAGRPADPSSLPTVLTNTEWLSILEPPFAVAWGDDMGRVHRGERVQYLTPLAGGGTRYETDEIMVGILSPVISKVFDARIRRGFAACGAALKRRVESLHG